MISVAEKKTISNGLDEILKKSASLMAKKGYHGTSMRDLAQTTERSLSGLYHYFNSKEELLFLINQRGFGSLLDMAKNIDTSVAAEIQLKTMIANHVSYFSDHLNEMRVMMFGTQSIDKKRSGIITELKDQYAELFEQVVSRYIHSLTHQIGSKNEISRRTYLLFGMMNWIYGWYSKTEHGSTNELIDDIYNTFTQGCVSHGVKTILTEND